MYFYKDLSNYNWEDNPLISRDKVSQQRSGDHTAGIVAACLCARCQRAHWPLLGAWGHSQL